MISEVTNEDNMEMMARYPAKFWDLAIVDPPYGIKISSNPPRQRFQKSNWDDRIPDDKYFDELFRVSKNQIIWGGNYFPYLWKTGCKSFIFWYKHQPVSNFADGELAWTSFDRPAACFDYQYFGNINSEKIRLHPTQKPVVLYDWILKNYAKQGDKILDTHLGSGSSRISAYKNKFDFWACEIDKTYFDAANERFKIETAAFGEDNGYF